MTKKKISNMEFAVINYFLTRSFFVGVTFSCLIRIIKQDSWIIPILSLLFGFTFIYLVNYIIKFKSNLCISEKINEVFKNKVSISINVLIVLIAFFYNIIN